jgi:CsoR family transcriptional regulator, copper-sensing transcriptional repressor
MNDTMQETTHRTPVSTVAKPDILRRLAYIEGHVQGVRRMVDEDKYCVDVLKQTYAVRRAIEKLEAMILENHLQGCVVEGIKEGREDAVIGELLDLYELAGR